VAATDLSKTRDDPHTTNSRKGTGEKV